MIDPAADLDLSDIEEVRRRVVEPVVAAMLRPGELDGVEVRAGTDHRIQAANWTRWHGHGSEDPDKQIFVVVRGGGESFACCLGDTEAPVDATTTAVDWADSLSDWICETSFGWGERPRELPTGFKAERRRQAE